jgi:predicted dehydrogenase
MAKLKIGIIGCGFIAPFHLDAYAKLGAVEVTGFCDIIPERAEAAAKKYGGPGAKVFADYKAMLAELRLDAISLCTENNLHCEIAVNAMEAGLHVFCEKPMSITGKEADEMVAASKRTGRKLTVGYVLRFGDQAQALRREVQEGRLGKIYYAEASAIRRRGVPTWGVFLDRKKQGGGPLMDIGTHVVDQTLWLMDDYSPVVSAVGNMYGHLIPLGGYNDGGHWDIEHFEVEDSAYGAVTLASGATLVVKAAWAANIGAGVTESLLFGVNGGADLKNNELTLNGEAHDQLWDAKPAGFPAREPNYAYDREIEVWVRALLDGNEPYVKCEEGAQVVKVLEAIYASARNGGKAVTY